MADSNLWNQDVWTSAEAFSEDCSIFIDDIQFSSRQGLSRINPSGRFQDAVLRQLQHLSYLMQSAIKNEDEEEFQRQANEFCEYAISNGYEVEELISKLEATDRSFEATDVEILYQTDQIIVPNNKILVLSVDRLLGALQKEPKLLFDMDPRKFEEVVAEIFYQNGFNVELTQQTRDGGKDIIAISSHMEIPAKYVIECKRYAPTRKVSLDIVQRLYGVRYALNASVGLVVTTSSFTRDAMQFAGQHPWELTLKGYESLMSWIMKLSHNSFNRDQLFRYAPKLAR